MVIKLIIEFLQWFLQLAQKYTFAKGTKRPTGLVPRKVQGPTGARKV